MKYFRQIVIVLENEANANLFHKIYFILNAQILVTRVMPNFVTILLDAKKKDGYFACSILNSYSSKSLLFFTSKREIKTSFFNSST